MGRKPKNIINIIFLTVKNGKETKKYYKYYFPHGKKREGNQKIVQNWFPSDKNSEGNMTPRGHRRLVTDRGSLPQRVTGSQHSAFPHMK